MNELRQTVTFCYLMNLKCYLLYLDTALKSHMGAGEEKEDTDIIILCRRSTNKFSQKIFEVWTISLTCLPSPTISVQTLPSPQIYFNFPGLNMALYDTWWDQF